MPASRCHMHIRIKAREQMALGGQKQLQEVRKCPFVCVLGFVSGHKAEGSSIQVMKESFSIS